MTISATDLQTKITKAALNMDRLDQIVNGSSTAVVAVDSGSVPSYAKLAATIGGIVPGSNGIQSDGHGNLVEYTVLFGTTGTNHTYAVGDWGNVVMRSNSGAAMQDMLPTPATAGGPMASGWYTYIYNFDSTAKIAVFVDTGGALILNGVGVTPGGFVVRPQELLLITSNGTGAYVGFILAPHRRQLLTAQNLYVATAANGGSDSNHGCDSSHPFLTIQHAVNEVMGNIDQGNIGITINIGAGTFNESVNVKGPVLGFAALFFQGAGIGSTIICGNSGGSCFGSEDHAFAVLSGVTLDGTNGAALGLQALKGSGMDFNTCGFSNFGAGTTHIAVNSNSHVICNGSYTVNSGGAAHIAVSGCGVFDYANFDTVVTIPTSGHTFSVAWVLAASNGVVLTDYKGGGSGVGSGLTYTGAGAGSSGTGGTNTIGVKAATTTGGQIGVNAFDTAFPGATAYTRGLQSSVGGGYIV